MTPTTIPADEVRFHPTSIRDPNGRLFVWRDELYRAVTAKTADRYRRIITDGLVDRLVQDGLLIDTEITPLELDGYELVLKHRRLPFVSYGAEWSGEMLREAALTILKLERELARRHLSLQDGHASNILFDFTRPVFVDFGSIGLLPRDRPWVSLEEFCRHFLLPMELIAAGLHQVGRAMLHVGVEWSQYDSLLRSGGGAPRRTDLPSFERYGDRESFIAALIERVEAVEVVTPRTDWSDYYRESFPAFTPAQGWDEKRTTVQRILGHCEPRTVLDVGANRGWYAQLAAHEGSQVVAFDTDESCVDRLYRDAREQSLPVLPLIMSFTEAPSADLLGIYTSADERLRCDLVLALALVHHLVFKSRLPFDHIAKGLASFTDRWLAVEFVPREDRHVSEWWTHHDDWYTLENLKAALGRHFSSISQLPSNPEPRVILLCER